MIDSILIFWNFLFQSMKVKLVLYEIFRHFAKEHMVIQPAEPLHPPYVDFLAEFWLFRHFECIFELNYLKLNNWLNQFKIFKSSIMQNPSLITIISSFIRPFSFHVVFDGSLLLDKWLIHKIFPFNLKSVVFMLIYFRLAFLSFHNQAVHYSFLT